METARKYIKIFWTYNPLDFFFLIWGLKEIYSKCEDILIAYFWAVVASWSIDMACYWRVKPIGMFVILLPNSPLSKPQIFLALDDS